MKDADISKLAVTFGEDWREWPAEWWGTRDWQYAMAKYQPLGEHLTTAPAQSLPAGFSIFPQQQRPPETKGARAVREIRNAKLGR